MRIALIIGFLEKESNAIRQQRKTRSEADDNLQDEDGPFSCFSWFFILDNFLRICLKMKNDPKKLTQEGTGLGFSVWASNFSSSRPRVALLIVARYERHLAWQPNGSNNLVPGWWYFFSSNY